MKTTHGLGITEIRHSIGKASRQDLKLVEWRILFSLGSYEYLIGGRPGRHKRGGEQTASEPLETSEPGCHIVNCPEQHIKQLSPQRSAAS